MPETSSKTSTTLDAVTAMVSQINPLLGFAIGAIKAVQTIREAAKAAGVKVTWLCSDHPEQVGAEGGTCPICSKPLVSSLPEDDELINRFGTSSGLLKQEAGDAKRWAQALADGQ